MGEVAGTSVGRPGAAGSKHLPGTHDGRDHAQRAVRVNPDGTVTRHEADDATTLHPYTAGAPLAVGQFLDGRALADLADDDMAELAAAVVDAFGEGHLPPGEDAASYAGRAADELRALAAQAADITAPDVFNGLAQRVQGLAVASPPSAALPPKGGAPADPDLPLSAGDRARYAGAEREVLGTTTALGRAWYVLSGDSDEVPVLADPADVESIDLPVETKAAPIPVGVVEEDDEHGTATVIVAVTGVVDQVDDIIEPGAFEATLRQRTPKGVWHHEWPTWVSRTEWIEELRPGDERLPKTTAKGDPWPAEAGALMVKTRFNLATQAGRDAYANVVFFGEQCEWSIGYAVPAGQSWRDSKGLRHIKMLLCYEYGPVLFGAHALTGTVDIKALRRRRENAVGTETKTAVAEQAPPADAPAAAEQSPPAAEEPTVADLHRDAFDELDWDEVAGAAAPVGVHAFLYPAEGDLCAFCGAAESDAAHGDPVETKAGVPAVADTPADKKKARALIRWYEHGEGAARIRWGTKGSFDRCVRIASDHMTRERAKGFCNLRHKGATGKYAGEKKELGVEVETKVHPPVDGSIEDRIAKLQRALDERFAGTVKDEKGRDRPKFYVWTEATFDDRVVVSVRDREDYDAERAVYVVPYTWDEDGGIVLGEAQRAEIQVTVDIVGVGSGSGTASGGPEGPVAVASESKAYPTPSGSWEDYQRRIRQAATDAVLGDMGDEDRRSHWVFVVATYDEAVIVQHSRPGEDGDEFIRFPYTWGDDGQAVLGEPEAVELDVTVVRTGEPAGEPEFGDVATKAGETAAKALAALETETKAGRVLSRSNVAAIAAAVDNLTAVLRRAGVGPEAKPGAKPEAKAAPAAPAAAPAETALPDGVDRISPVEIMEMERLRAGV